jgi:hypothetical protein
MRAGRASDSRLPQSTRSREKLANTRNAATGANGDVRRPHSASTIVIRGVGEPAIDPAEPKAVGLREATCREGIRHRFPFVWSLGLILSFVFRNCRLENACDTPRGGSGNRPANSLAPSGAPRPGARVARTRPGCIHRTRSRASCPATPLPSQCQASGEASTDAALRSDLSPYERVRVGRPLGRPSRVRARASAD